MSETEKSGHFPASWPSECPPADSAPANGSFFRLVSGNPPAEKDFRSLAETGKSAPEDAGLCCMYHGISVLPSLRDAMHQRGLFPKLGKHIAVAQLTSAHGRTRPTPSKRQPAHHTWWPYVGVARHTVFVVQDEE